MSPQIFEHIGTCDFALPIENGCRLSWTGFRCYHLTWFRGTGSDRGTSLPSAMELRSLGQMSFSSGDPSPLLGLLIKVHNGVVGCQRWLRRSAFRRFLLSVKAFPQLTMRHFWACRRALRMTSRWGHEGVFWQYMIDPHIFKSVPSSALVPSVRSCNSINGFISCSSMGHAMRWVSDVQCQGHLAIMM